MPLSIAFDATSDGADPSGTTCTTSHTCSGNQRLLVVATRGGAGEGDRVSSITYDGVALTKAGNQAKPESLDESGLYYLANPASGANNAVINLTAEGSFMSWAIASYTGVSQESPLDSSTTNTQLDNATFAISTTTVADNCWLVGSINGVSSPNAGANTTKRGNGGDNLFDSNAPLTPAGSGTLNVTGGDGETNWAGVIASFAPFSSKVGGGFIHNLI